MTMINGKKKYKILAIPVNDSDRLISDTVDGVDLRGLLIGSATRPDKDKYARNELKHIIKNILFLSPKNVRGKLESLERKISHSDMPVHLDLSRREVLANSVGLMIDLLRYLEDEE